MSDTRFGRYELVEFLGKGGVAEVYRALVMDGPLCGDQVALKRLLAAASGDPGLVDAFVTEADLCRNLRHPNIIDVLEAGVVDDTFYIAMEYIAGSDLAKLLRECKRREIYLPVDFACFAAHTVANALDYAHNATDRNDQPLGLVHCDVTPSNIFISARGQIKLADFGGAYLHSIGTTIADEGRVMGKPHYMGAEQVAGLTLTPSTDLFGLGVVLYATLTNRLPFTGSTHAELWGRMLDWDLHPPSFFRAEVPPEVDELVLTALSPRRQEDVENDNPLARKLAARVKRFPWRYRCAADFANDLSMLYDPSIGTPLGLASVVRLLGQLS
jgi:serine/threonine-protein kinase